MLACTAALITALGSAASAGADPRATVLPGVPPAGPPPETATDVREYELTPLSLLPESVVYDERSEAFYASSENGGAITKGTLDGAPAEVFLPPGSDGRTEAVGVEIDDDNRLYVAGGSTGKLFVYDLATRALVADFSTGPGGFLNDLTIVPETGDVYATDSFRPRIYRWTEDQVEAGGGEPEIIPLAPEVSVSPVGTNPPKPFNANGIRVTPDGEHIVFGDLNDAALYRLTPPPPGEPEQRTITRIRVDGGSLGDVDGLRFVGSTLYAADNGGERILRLAPSADHTRVTIQSATTSPAFHTPTGIAEAPEGRLLIANSELFDPNGPPFFVDSIPRP